MNFIQIGSNVGDTDNDHLWPLVRKNNWTGILVEPNPKAFAKLKENYQDVPGLIFINKAVSNKNETLTLYVDKYETEGLSQHASCVLEHMTVHRHGPMFGEPPLKEIKVEAVTLDSIVLENNMSGIPFEVLQLDTEGYDAHIILASNFKNHILPERIIFEHSHTDGPHKIGPLWNKSVEHLVDAGYKIDIITANDTIMIKTNRDNLSD